jgi:putative PIN family toxin of toxin-antitoxin system
MKVVLDANVIVAAFAARGLCESILELCLSDHDLVVSEHLLTEVRRNLVGKLGLPAALAQDIIGLLRQHGRLVQPAAVEPGTCRDTDDLPVLGVAITAEADCIVTGDKDLLILGQFRGVAIHSPRDFADALR